MAFQFAIALALLPQPGAIRLKISGQGVLVSRLGDAVVAVSARCPHLGVPMRSADISANGTVTCWFHGARFDLQSGKLLRPPLSASWRNDIPLGMGHVVAAVVPARCGELTRFPVEIRDTGIWIDTHHKLEPISAVCGSATRAAVTRN
jgi:3-phenylpropionate/trans-cinnamate dioxygenase ferredoxin component